MKKDRVSYPKGSPENAMLKLALNGMYGDSNNQFSPFFDPQYTMTITINGQLLLCMLAEKLMEISGVKLVQINTDGVTVKVPRSKIAEIEAANKKWMELTKLDLERADYKRMFIRDVNNYIGEYTNGKLKRKGAYEYEIGWHQNHSALVVQKVVEEHLVKGTSVPDLINYHMIMGQVHDFMLRTKVPRTSRLMWGDTKIQNTTRYYMSKTGRQLTKIMPPLAKNPGKERPIKIHDGWKVTHMNTMREVSDIDPRWYIEEAEKLVAPLYDGMLNEMMG
jgi:hypothetical protein